MVTNPDPDSVSFLFMFLNHDPTGECAKGRERCGVQKVCSRNNVINQDPTLLGRRRSEMDLNVRVCPTPGGGGGGGDGDPQSLTKIILWDSSDFHVG